MGRRKKGFINQNFKETVENETVENEQLQDDIQEEAIETEVAEQEEATEQEEVIENIVEVVEIQEEDLNKKYDKNYFEFLKKNGNDVNFKGAWQRSLVRWLNGIFKIRKAKLLEIGCAAGNLVDSFNEFGINAIGVDASEYVINNSPFNKLNLINLPAWEVDKLPSKFDFVFSMETLSHIPEAKIIDSLKAIRSVCNSGAILFATIKLHNELLDSFESFAVSQEEWKNLLEETGFEDITSICKPKLYAQHTPTDFMRAYSWDLVIGRAK